MSSAFKLNLPDNASVFAYYSVDENPQKRIDYIEYLLENNIVSSSDFFQELNILQEYCNLNHLNKKYFKKEKAKLIEKFKYDNLYNYCIEHWIKFGKVNIYSYSYEDKVKYFLSRCAYFILINDMSYNGILTDYKLNKDKKEEKKLKQQKKTRKPKKKNTTFNKIEKIFDQPKRKQRIEYNITNDDIFHNGDKTEFRNIFKQKIKDVKYIYKPKHKGYIDKSKPYKAKWCYVNSKNQFVFDNQKFYISHRNEFYRNQENDFILVACQCEVDYKKIPIGDTYVKKKVLKNNELLFFDMDINLMRKEDVKFDTSH